MAKESKSVRLSDEVISFVESHQTNVNRGDFTYNLEFMLRSEMNLIPLTKMELQGYFTTSEACYIVDCLNGHWYQTVSPKSSLWLNCKDADIYDGLAAKWEVDLESFLGKLEKLTNYQAHVVFLMANEFWSMDDEVRNRRPIQETVKAIFGAV